MSFFKINNRRYTGSKQKLSTWIINNINNEINFKSFFDIFAGTGCISSNFIHIDKLIINDFLFSNNVIYKAFSKKRPVMGMHGYGGQHIVIDFEKSRIVVTNSIHENWSHRKSVYLKLRKGIK